MLIKCIKKHCSNNGLTLIEVLVAITILAMLAMAFISLIGFNFTNIFTAGEKSKAIAKAKEKTDELYALVDKSVNAPETLDAFVKADGYKDNYDALFEASDDQRALFCYETKNIEMELDNSSYVEGYEVTVVVFYGNGKHHVQLDSFIYQQSSQLP